MIHRLTSQFLEHCKLTNFSPGSIQTLTDQIIEFKVYLNFRKLRRSTSKDEAKRQKRDQFIIGKHQNYFDVCQYFVIRAKDTIRILRELGILSMSLESRLISIEEYIGHAEGQIDQIRRRVVFDEKIPHKEKVFSIFETHTEWISKGKVGVAQE
jgi:hypothetical protein